MLGYLLVIAVSTTWAGCSMFHRNMSSVLPKVDEAKLKKEVANDPFPSAQESGIGGPGVAVISDN